MSQKAIPFAFLASILWACSGGVADPLVDACSGQYTCTTGSTSVTTTLVKQTNGCFAGEIRLGSDHKATLPSGREGSWAGSVERFDVCEGSDCVVCTANTPSEPAYDAATHISKCVKGSDAATIVCSRFEGDVQSCALYGCTMGYGGDGGKQMVCGGEAAQCSSYVSEQDCTARPDCEWQ